MKDRDMYYGNYGFSGYYPIPNMPIFDTFIKKCLLDLIKSSFFMYLVLRT